MIPKNSLEQSKVFLRILEKAGDIITRSLEVTVYFSQLAL